jgi:hypothetical protein
VFGVLEDPDAVGWSRRGLFRRIAGELGDLRRLRAQLAAVEAEMRAVLGGELGLSRLGDIPGLTLTGAAVILAEARVSEILCGGDRKQCFRRPQGVAAILGRSR